MAVREPGAASMIEDSRLSVAPPRRATCSLPARCVPSNCRTSGRRLGYVQQMFVDPTSLAVVSLYLRRAANPIGAKNGEGEHKAWHCVQSASQQLTWAALVECARRAAG